MPEKRSHEKNPEVESARSHFRNAREEMSKTVEAFLPPGVVAHRKAARKEFLLGLRSLVNVALTRLDQETATPASSGTQKEPDQD